MESAKDKVNRWRRENPDRAKSIAKKSSLKLRIRNKQIIIEAKSKPCMDCGKSYPYYVMDLDHRPGEIKEFAIARHVLCSVERLLAEIAKCDAVCSNCHRVRTFKRLGFT